jgi:hypothetical protein
MCWKDQDMVIMTLNINVKQNGYIVRGGWRYTGNCAGEECTAFHGR